MAELPRPALFILVPTCHRAPTTTRCSQTCFILLYRSFFQRLKAELLGCCPTAHCTVGMYRTALIFEQTLEPFTFLSFSVFFFSNGHMHGTKDCNHFTNEKHLYEMFSDAELLEKSRMGRAVLMQ